MTEDTDTATPAADILAQEPTTEYGKRSVTYRFVIRETAGGGAECLRLHASHWPDSKRYRATAQTSTVEYSSGMRVETYPLFANRATVLSEDCARYSARRFEEFAGRAVAAARADALNPASRLHLLVA